MMIYCLFLYHRERVRERERQSKTQKKKIHIDTRTNKAREKKIERYTNVEKKTHLYSFEERDSI